MKFVIDGRLDGLNDYTRACRKNRYAGADMKKKNQQMVNLYVLRAKLKKITNYPCKLQINFYEGDLKRDVDNIGFGTKFILDSLVEMGVLENDSRKYVTGVHYDVFLDRNNPRVEVEIYECGAS